ncbi:hypothetical protein LYNGBM3L_20340 [Moorena producens 3L]|uniref:Uncharacterized protein n=1 Tax=Moorena producens 3L TaxID=489825 RepID=F4XMN3_9CYAN|nr:hypothetical protein LYNGBM3L_20340 [Moorena producens 3L]
MSEEYPKPFGCDPMLSDQTQGSRGGNPPRNLAMQRGLGEPVRSWGFPP